MVIQYTGLHIQKAYTSLGTSSKQILLLSAHACCKRIAIDTQCVHLVYAFRTTVEPRLTNAYIFIICMSSEQNNLVYALWQEVPKLVNAIWTCKPVNMLAILISDRVI